MIAKSKIQVEMSTKFIFKSVKMSQKRKGDERHPMTSQKSNLDIFSDEKILKANGKSQHDAIPAKAADINGDFEMK